MSGQCAEAVILHHQSNTIIIMRKKILLWSCMLLLTGTAATAQETEPKTSWHHNLYVELGPKFTSHLSPNLEPFRPTGGWGAYINVGSRMRTWQASARYEIVSPNYHWALRTGLQYGFNYKRIGYKQAEEEFHTMDYVDTEWYYFQVDNENQLEYLLVKGIEQHSHYLGIPLELRYYFNSGIETFRMYLAAEADFDFLVGNRNKVNFLNKDGMAPYAEQVTKHYANPDPMNASTYFGAGFQVGDLNGIGVGFNWLIHLFEINGSTGMLPTKPKFAGSKLQIELVIPLK